MRGFALGCLLCASANIVIAKPLSIFASCHEAQPRVPANPNFVTFEFFVLLRNVSNTEIQVPTAGYIDGFEHDYSTARLGCLLHLDWDFYQDRFHERVVPSRSELHIVVLKPGEAAQIRWRSKIYLPGKLAKAGVRLNIESQFAKRFGLWSGVLTAEEIEIDPLTGRDVD